MNDIILHDVQRGRKTNITKDTYAHIKSVHPRENIRWPQNDNDHSMSSAMLVEVYTDGGRTPYNDRTRRIERSINFKVLN